MTFRVVPQAHATTLPTQTKSRIQRHFKVPIGNGMLIELKGSGAGDNMCLVVGHREMKDHSIFKLIPQLEKPGSSLEGQEITATRSHGDGPILSVYGTKYVFEILKSSPVLVH